MRHTFYHWLQREVESGRRALLGLYEKKDHLLYVEAPPLRKKYMELIGTTEEGVLQAELDVVMLRRKTEMIQSALNRRETVDLEAIEQQLETEKQEKISELEHADLTLNELPQLSEQEEKDIQRQYREIINMFHPELNPDITDTQKELYQKALEAYKLQDKEAMKLVYEMLFQNSGNMELEVAFNTREESAHEQRAGYRTMADVLATDYKLAKKLYSCFLPLEEDQVVLDTLQTYEEERKYLEDQIEDIQAGFPFNARDLINDSAKIQEYLAELRVRGKQAEEEKDRLEKKIAELTEEKEHV
ncbi:MAG: hypothetical protein IJ106_06980 [Parasporobacterium sp.]|nr:hypothetical protein [Parasporobacterium sp.]